MYFSNYIPNHLKSIEFYIENGNDLEGPLWF